MSPLTTPPVCRILDFGQFHYEQSKRERDQKRKSRVVESKELKLRVKIGIADFDTKARQTVGFLNAGHRVRVSVQFRGREVSHANLGHDLLLRFAAAVAGHGSMERPPLLEGKSMAIQLLPGAAKPVPAAIVE